MIVQRPIERAHAAGPRPGGADPRNTRWFSLWFGLLGPPLAWAANLILGDMIFELGCSRGVQPHRILGLSLDFWALLQTGATAAVSAVAGALAYRAWQRLRREETETVAVGRARAMAIAGMVSGGLYLLLIGFGFLPVFFLRTCGTSL
jgi:hypothetical protein